jgi:preprotein translocase subunit SecA
LTVSGLKVDIVTTSPILARRDVIEQKEFFGLMGIEVAHNFEDNQRDPKMCYEGKRKVVYGTPHSFQVDILIDEYKLRGTRNKRPYQVVIVDEVDSMFIDQKDHQTLLATVYPGFS